MKTALLLSTLVVFAIYKLLLFGFERPVAWLTNLAVESLVVALAWLFSAWAAGRASRVLRGVGDGLFYVCLAISYLSNFAHTYFFGAAVERQFSLLDMNFGQIGFFFRKVLPVDGVFTLVGLALVTVVGARTIARRLRPARLTWPARAVGFNACLVAALAAFSDSRIPSPTVDMLSDLRDVLLHPRVELDARKASPSSLAFLDKSGTRPTALSTPFKKVVVIVFETVNERTLREEIAQLSAGTFLRKAAVRAHVYDRYYTTNQDSRTGMLGMLSSRFIPHDAYTEAGRDHYMHLANRSSLADLFHSFGYQTAFAVSQTELELVVSELEWQDILSLSDQEADAAHGRFLCFNPYEFEHSCEDRALLPKVVQFLSHHDRAFVYQEMIWGHTVEYNQASGKSNAAYYSEYLDALAAALSERGLLDETLIAITADHGLRNKTLQLEPWIAHVPMWFYAIRFGATRHRGLYSHLDFKDLLLHELVPGSPEVPDNPFVFVVGPTGTSFRSVVTRDGGFLVFKERDDARYVWHESGPIATPGQASPSAYLKLFETYRSAFERGARKR